MDLSGAPKTVFTVTDSSVIKDTPISGIVCLQGETMRGEIAKPQFVGNSIQFKRKFGGLHPTSRFAEYCIRMLDAGIKLWVSPVSHFTDLTDKSTAVGTKATGTLTVSANAIVFRAKHLGLGYNGTVVTAKAADSLEPDMVDIVISVPESDQTETLSNVPTTVTVDQISALNLRLQNIAIVSVTGTIPTGSVALAGAVHDASTVTADDYNGDNIGKTGWYAFTSVRDAFRIANIHKADPDIDAGLAAYAMKRMDMRFHWGAPVAANAEGIEDYRMGSGAYTHSPINTWLGSFIAGSVNITGPGNARYDIPGIVDALPLYARKDLLNGYNFTAAGPQRGIISMPNNGVEAFNLGSPDNQEDFDRLYKMGVNAVIEDDTFGTVLWGNASALRDRTKILARENVADLVMYILRELKPRVRFFQFDPTDPEMFKRLYRSVRPFITDELEAKRAIRPGENKDWFWLGDQDATLYTDAKFNTISDLESGRYRARFVFKPTPATEFIGIDIMAADSNSIEFSLTQNV